MLHLLFFGEGGRESSYCLSPLLLHTSRSTCIYFWISGGREEKEKDPFSALCFPRKCGVVVRVREYTHMSVCVHRPTLTARRCLVALLSPQRARALLLLSPRARCLRPYLDSLSPSLVLSSFPLREDDEDDGGGDAQVPPQQQHQRALSPPFGLSAAALCGGIREEEGLKIAPSVAAAAASFFPAPNRSLVQ